MKNLTYKLITMVLMALGAGIISLIIFHFLQPLNWRLIASLPLSVSLSVTVTLLLEKIWKKGWSDLGGKDVLISISGGVGSAIALVVALFF